MEKPHIIYLSEKNNQFGLTLEGKGGILKRIFYYGFVNFLNILPNYYGRKVFIESSEKIKEIYRHRSKTLALEIIYNHKRKSLLRFSFIDNLVYNIMNNVENGRAVRNRLKIVECILKDLILKNKKKDIIRITSIAAGSARSIFKALACSINDFEGIIEVIFVDKDGYAIEYSKNLAKEFSLSERYKFTWIQCPMSEMGTHIDLRSQDIIEMVGLLDYFDVDKSLILIKDKIFPLLSAESYYIVANIRENREVPFVSNLFQWNMYYKEPRELYKILLQAGFDYKNVTLIIEPLKIHTIAIANKNE